MNTKECRVDGCTSTELATRRPVCKDHHREDVRRHYRENKQYYVDKAARNNQKTKDWVREKKNVPCMDCQKSYPFYVMDFDHRENKSFDISKYMTRYGRARIEAEIAKCDVVCSNCHRERTWKRATNEVHI